MHPLSTALLIMGYALALPLAGRLPVIVAHQQRLALGGHQAGMMVALIGWMTRGSYTVAVAHGVWLIAVKIWFDLARRRGGQRPIQHGDSTG